MSFSIRSTSSSMFAARYMQQAYQDAAQATERLSSGKRINSARDDAAGLGKVISLSSRIDSLTAANANAQDGVNAAGVQEDALSSISDILVQMRTLSTQYNNTSLLSAQRQRYSDEFDALKTQIGTIQSNTQYNNVALLGASNTALTFQIGANTGDTANLRVGAVSVTTANINSTSSVDNVISTVDGVRGTVAMQSGTFERAIKFNTNLTETYTKARSSIEDADIVAETTNLSNAKLRGQYASYALAQFQDMQRSLVNLLA